MNRNALLAALAAGSLMAISAGCAHMTTSAKGTSRVQPQHSADIRGVHVDVGTGVHRGDYADIRLTTSDGRVIYIDPCTITGRHDAELVLVTHLHDDHFCPKKILEAKNDRTALVLPATARDEAKRLADESKMKIVFAAPGQEHVVNGFRVEVVPAYTAVNAIHARSFGWVGYVITVEGSRFYASGDTALVPELETLKADAVFLNIGGDVARDVFGGKDIGMLTGSDGARLANTIKPEVAFPLHAFEDVHRRDLDAFLENVDKVIKVIVLTPGRD
jgi:L-ascorbate metabolism protein UlaG (beta-lactamase superfamily)